MQPKVQTVYFGDISNNPNKFTLISYCLRTKNVFAEIILKYPMVVDVQSNQNVGTQT